MGAYFSDVLVIGSGVVGMTAALGMRAQGYEVALFCASKAASQGAPGRIYAINASSQALLDRLHVWEALPSHERTFFNQMEIWERGTKAPFRLHAEMADYETLGFMVSDPALREVLFCRLKEEKIPTFFEEALVSIETLEGGVTVQTTTMSFATRLLVIADGACSLARERLNVPVWSFPYHQKAITVMVHTQHPHQNTAFQVFGENEILAFLPLADPHHSAIVWSVSHGASEALCQLTTDEFCKKLEASYERRLGAVSLITSRQVFPLMMRYAKQFSGDHWVLLGDSAHTIHPLAGLGLNLGLSDVRGLCERFKIPSGRAFSRQALGAFGRERKHAAIQLIALMTGIKTLFLSPLWPIRLLRRLGLSKFRHLGFLQIFLIEKARKV